MKFRIMKNDLGFYPQVKLSWFKPWQKIAKHPSGYGLYSKKNIEYPCKTEEEAANLIDDFYAWYRKDKKLKFSRFYGPNVPNELHPSIGKPKRNYDFLNIKDETRMPK